MKVVGISGSIVGSKTKTAMNYVASVLEANYSNTSFTMLNLKDYNMDFSDGRHYLDYTGDTQYVVQQIMEADAIIIGTPIFQASIPGTLKNLFDLLPEQGLRDKVVSIVVTAGSARHFLIAEQQLKPILAYMKAQIVQTYVFLEEKDFYRKEIVNQDVLFRMDRLVEDTIVLGRTYLEIKRVEEEKYGF